LKYNKKLGVEICIRLEIEIGEEIGEEFIHTELKFLRRYTV